MDLCPDFVFYLESSVIFCFVVLFVVVGVLIYLRKLTLHCPRKNIKNYENLDEDVGSNTDQRLSTSMNSAEITSLKEQLRHYQATTNSLKTELRNETEAKEEALTRLSSIMSSRLKDGNPNVADLSDENRPVKIGEQFSELYDNQWTDAFSAIETHITLNEQNIQEDDIVTILLHVLQISFTICEEKANKQLNNFNEYISGIAAVITKKSTDLSRDLMHRIKEERKWCAADSLPDVHEAVSRIKDQSVFRRLETDFLDVPALNMYISECLKVCWFMVIQDPPMKLLFKQQTDAANEVFKAYKHNGNNLYFIVWPALFLTEKGPLLQKGVAEFGD